MARQVTTGVTVNFSAFRIVWAKEEIDWIHFILHHVVLCWIFCVELV